MKLTIYTDGGARGNPGPAGIGVVMMREAKIIERLEKYIGKATNNQAEYQALILGLEKAKDLGATEIECRLDSELVVKQMKCQYKVRDADLAQLFLKAWNLSAGFKKITYHHVPREQNEEADKLVNEAIDKALKRTNNK